MLTTTCPVFQHQSGRVCDGRIVIDGFADERNSVGAPGATIERTTYSDVRLPPTGVRSKITCVPVVSMAGR